MVRIPDLTDAQLARQIAKYSELAAAAATPEDRATAKDILGRLDLERKSRQKELAVPPASPQSAPLAAVNVSFEAGVMALKGGRHDEAEHAFLAAAKDDPRLSDAWSALGICKLYQLANGRTVDEALHAFSHAKRVEPNRIHDVDRLCMEHATVVVTRYYEILLASVDQGHQAKARTLLGGALALVSTVGGVSSSNTFVQLAALGGVGGGAAVAVNSLSDIQDIKLLQHTVVGLVVSIRNGIDGFVDHSLPEYKQFAELAAQLSTPALSQGLSPAARNALPPGAAVTDGSQSPSTLFIVCLVVCPYVAAWFTLRAGYSVRVRILSFSWLGLLLIMNIAVALTSANR